MADPLSAWQLLSQGSKAGLEAVAPVMRRQDAANQYRTGGIGALLQNALFQEAKAAGTAQEKSATAGLRAEQARLEPFIVGSENAERDAETAEQEQRNRLMRLFIDGGGLGSRAAGSQGGGLGQGGGLMALADLEAALSGDSSKMLAAAEKGREFRAYGGNFDGASLDTFRKAMSKELAPLTQLTERLDYVDNADWEKPLDVYNGLQFLQKSVDEGVVRGEDVKIISDLTGSSLEVLLASVKGIYDKGEKLPAQMGPDIERAIRAVYASKFKSLEDVYANAESFAERNNWTEEAKARGFARVSQMEAIRKRNASRGVTPEYTSKIDEARNALAAITGGDPTAEEVADFLDLVESQPDQAGTDPRAQGGMIPANEINWQKPRG